MVTQSINVDLPGELYEQLKQRSAQAGRTIEAELVQVVSSVVPVAGKITPDLTERLTQMRTLDNAALWQAAHSRLSKPALARLQSLNNKRQREGLTEAEARKVNELAHEYERVVLLRSQAIGLLKERGEDISEFQPHS
jgi:plasmid stability protein/uncharacterized protein YnzC (UPF0291/DUF896 family)